MNVVFDLGGVVVTYDRASLMAELYADPRIAAAVHESIEHHLDWPGLDRGTVPEPEAISLAAHAVGVTPAEVARFMDRMAVSWTPVPATVALLYELRDKGHRLFCLSNMHPASTAFLERAFTFWDAFTGKVISCQVGHCKPEPAIYAHLLGRYGLAAPETLFIDDLDVNLAAAAAFGIRTIRFESAEQVAVALRELGCL